jgi:alpha-galactosidase
MRVETEPNFKSRTGMTLTFDPDRLSFTGAPIELSGLVPIVGGSPLAAAAAPERTGAGWRVSWPGHEPGTTFHLTIEGCALPDGREGLQVRYGIEGLEPGAAVDRFGLRIGAVGNVRTYLRSGYHSWDGTFYMTPEGSAADDALTMGYALTQLLPGNARGSLVLGFLRHDRFQHCFRFDATSHPLTLEIETLWDEATHKGAVESEPLLLFEHPEVENALRLWARAVVEALPRPPRIVPRITGWCSWYNLYAAIDEANIRDHLAVAREVARTDHLPLRVFQIDDGFTPEMGDWLAMKPQFPHGMKPLMDEIRDAGFMPGLWIAPHLVGNRSRLFGEHPDWVVRDRATGEPITAMTFHGEFRWHKRSEEYYILDITHLEAEAYIRNVFRTWRQDWGCEYFKTDFMHFGSAHGPDRAVWREAGLTRIEIWMRMARLIREEIGDAVWLGCGCPLFAPVGLVDGIRIGRDMGVSWGGERPAENLLRDQTTRNFGHGILWQADPDCILLRDRFHEFADHEIEGLALLAGLAGGVTMTSDHLGELSSERRALWSFILGEGQHGRCDFPLLGRSAEFGSLIAQISRDGSGDDLLFLFNTGEIERQWDLALAELGITAGARLVEWPAERLQPVADGRFSVVLAAHHWRLFRLLPPARS